MKLKTVLVAATLSLIASTGALAQATRTWVSGVGDDANPCSRTAPCKTWAGAISKTAPGGEIDALDPGGYGALTITKSITINGEGTYASTLVAGTNGLVVAAAANDVVIIRNISIDGLLGNATNSGNAGINGIRFLSGKALHVENVHIFGFNQQGIDVANSGASDFFMNNVSIRNCAGGGVYLHPVGASSLVATLNHVVLDQNGRGMRAEDNVVVSIRDTSATGNVNNGFVGVALAAGPVDMTMDNVQSSNNGAVGIFAGAGTTVRMANSIVVRNNAGLQATGGGSILSWGNNFVNANSGFNGPASGPISPI